MCGVRALRRAPQNCAEARTQLFISSKIWWTLWCSVTHTVWHTCDEERIARWEEQNCARGAATPTVLARTCWQTVSHFSFITAP